MLQYIPKSIQCQFQIPNFVTNHKENAIKQSLLECIVYKKFHDQSF